MGLELADRIFYNPVESPYLLAFMRRLSRIEFLFSLVYRWHNILFLDGLFPYLFQICYLVIEIGTTSYNINSYEG